MADDDIEIGEDIDVAVIEDEDGTPVGAIVDDVIVATGPDGSVVDETVDILDADGELIAEDETVTVFDADGELVGAAEAVTVADDE